MDKSIGILDRDYSLWVKELVKRYRGSQIKVAIKVNKELLRYYWELGKDIEEKQADNKYGSKFYATLSRDLRHEMPDVEGLSETSIRYAKRFYTLYSQQIAILPQVVEESEKENLPFLSSLDDKIELNRRINDILSKQTQMVETKKITTKLAL